MRAVLTVMPWRWGILGLGLLLSGLWPLPAQTPPEHIEAYVHLVKAGQEEQRGNLAAALDHFQQARELYLKVSQLYPDWQPDIVRYRSTYAQNQLERLRRLVAPAPGVSEDAADLAPTRPDPVAFKEAEQSWADERAALELAIEELEEERTTLRDKILALEAELEQAMAAAGQARDNLEKSVSAARERDKKRSADQQELKKALESMQSENQELHARISAFEAGQGGVQAELEQLRANHAALLEQLETERSAAASERDELVGRIEVMKAFEQSAELLTAREAELEETRRHIRQLTEQAATLSNRVVEVTAAAQSAVSELNRERERFESEARTRSADHARLQGELETLQEQIRRAAETSAAQSNQVIALQSDMKQAAADSAKTRKSLEAERDRLSAEVAALKQTVDDNQSEMKKVRDLRAALRAMEKENKELVREIAGLNRTIERLQQTDQASQLKAQNSVLMEELRVFRAHLNDSERRNRELERELGLLRQSMTTP